MDKDYKLDVTEYTADDRRLKDVFGADFDLGVAVNPRVLEESGDLVARHFNSLTCENEMKPSSLYDKNQCFDFTSADIVANFAREHGMKLRGHTLVWHNQTPGWFFLDEKQEKKLTPDALLARLRMHLETVLPRYRDVTSCWDLVNEAVSDDGPGILRESPWRAILGDRYLERIFTLARDIDPDMPFFYNDYNEAEAGKRSRMIQMLRELKAAGLEPDGIGMQCHWNLYYPGKDAIRAAIEDFAALDLKLHITELDVSVYRSREDVAIAGLSSELEELQAERYAEIFSIFREYKRVIENVSLWGMSDQRSWLNHFPVKNRPDHPLLFSKDSRMKAAGKRLLSFGE